MLKKKEIHRIKTKSLVKKDENMKGKRILKQNALLPGRCKLSGKVDADEYMRDMPAGISPDLTAECMCAFLDLLAYQRAVIKRRNDN